MDRRFYERLPLYVDCMIIDQSTGKEYQAKLCDISEGGVGVLLAAGAFPNVGSSCSIQFVDTFENRNFVISETFSVSNIARSPLGARIGGAFRRALSQQCRSYIQLLSAKRLLNLDPLFLGAAQ